MTTTEITDPQEIQKLFGARDRQAPALASVMPPSAAQEQDREIRMVLSDESVDSFGTIFLVDGWEPLREGGVPLLVQHDRGKFPIGRIHTLEKGMHRGRKALIATARVAPAGLDPEADRAYGLAKAGIITDVSVGFDPKAVDRVTDPERRKALGLPPGGYVFTRTALLEGSMVSIGANSNAQITSVRAFAPDDMRKALEQFAPQFGAAIMKAMEPRQSLSGGNEDEPTLRELMALQGARLEAIERAVQTLLARDIGGEGGAKAPVPEPVPKGGDSLYANLLGAAQTLSRGESDVRSGSAGSDRQRGGAHP